MVIFSQVQSSTLNVKTDKCLWFVCESHRNSQNRNKVYELYTLTTMLLLKKVYGIIIIVFNVLIIN